MPPCPRCETGKRFERFLREPSRFPAEKGGKVALGRVGRTREEDLEKAIQPLLKK